MKILVLVLAVLMPLAATAAPSVRVLALFTDKAMLDIDGKRQVLSVGKKPVSGVRLIRANTAEAVVEIDGKRQTLQLGSAVAASYAVPTQREIRVLKDDRRDGYFVDGLINGQPIRFLIDTGATSVAMSERHAAKLGISHRVDGTQVGVGTASGRAMGHQIRLRELSVGGVRVNDVRAVVIDGDSPRFVLLGMNVLDQFDLEQSENLLILRSRL